MKQFFIKLVFGATLFGFMQNGQAQTYRHALKFNYGVFNYNDKTSVAIKEPFDRPFSLGGQFQSNFSKAFTNSIGFNTYKWSNNSSYNIQEMLFLRNNARLLNRLKPQIGFGLGFEESKMVVGNINTYTQYAYIPVNVGLQTDLTNRISLGIFGEIKYGFDLENFNINNGSILPNNTAGISIAYRISKVKERVAYPEINWDDTESLITVASLKSYQYKKMGIDTTNNHSVLSPLSATYKGKNTFLVDDTPQANIKMKALQPIMVADSISYYKDDNNKIVLDKSLAYDTTFKQTLSTRTDSVIKQKDSLTVYVPNFAAKNKGEEFLKTNASGKSETSTNFKLADFTESPKDTVYVINKVTDLTHQPASANTYINPQQTSPNTNYSVPQNTEAMPQNSIYTPNNQAEVTYTVPVQRTIPPHTTPSALQVAETSSSALLNAQLSKLITLQTQTLALLTAQAQTKSDSNLTIFPNKSGLDSLKLWIAYLEYRLNNTQKENKEEPFSKAAETSFGPITLTKSLCIINYQVNKTDLTDAQRNIIINNVFKNYTVGEGYKISIASFTDRSGSETYNKKLSDLRLKKAVQFLQVLGIKPEDIISKSYGESKSSQSQNSEERRLEIKIVEKYN